MSDYKEEGTLRRLQVVLLGLCAVLTTAAVMAANPKPEGKGLSQSAAEQTSPIPMSRLGGQQRKRLEEMLTRQLQIEVNQIERIEGQSSAVTVEVTLDVKESMVVANFSRSFLPKYNGADWEDLTQSLGNSIDWFLYDLIEYHGTEFLIDGRDILEYYPDELSIIGRESAYQAMQKNR